MDGIRHELPLRNLVPKLSRTRPSRGTEEPNVDRGGFRLTSRSADPRCDIRGNLIEQFDRTVFPRLFIPVDCTAVNEPSDLKF